MSALSHTEDCLWEVTEPAGRAWPGTAPATQTMAAEVLVWMGLLEDALGHVFAAASSRQFHCLSPPEEVHQVARIDTQMAIIR